MLKRIFRYKWYIAIITVLMVLDPAITSWMVLWLQRMFNSVDVGTPRIDIIRLTLIGILAWVGKRLLLYAMNLLKSRFICNIKQDLKHDIFTGAMGLNTANIAELGTSGDYISAFTNDINIIEQKYFSNIMGLISQIFAILIMGATFLTMNRKLALTMFLFGILVMAVPPLFAKLLNSTNLKYSKSLSRFTQRLKEYLTAYSTIKNYSIEKIVLSRFDKSNTDVEGSKFEYDSALALADGIGALLTYFTRILVIGVGLIMVSKGEVLIGTVIAAQTFADELASPLLGVVVNINSIRSVRSIINRISDLTSKTEEYAAADAASDDASAPSETDGARLDVVFSNLTIPFPERNIVENFSFEFKQGGKYLVIGKNGSGKSSVFKALKKRFSDYQGSILINGTELRDVSNEEISRLITYLNENVSIFSGSIADNITFWRKISEATYSTATKDAHVELDAEREVGEDGFNISSGEQRRIEIARSLILPTKLMIFDEVVSTLDIETAYDIERMALGYADKTVVFISHNFSGKLIREYDEILVMKDGSLIAHGSYDTLMQTNEYFRSICEIKFGTV